MFFYLQTLSSQRLSPEVAVFAEAVQEHNWLHPDNRHNCIWGIRDFLSASSSVRRSGADTVVPVGSLEFIQDACAQLLKIPVVKAVNIPPELNADEFLGRKVWSDLDIAKEKELCARFGKLLVKPGKTPKRFEMVLDTGKESFPADEPLFVSQLLPHEITSEWRAFCLNGKVLSIHPYGPMSVWRCPDKELVQQMARLTMNNCPSSALDVAVLENGQTVAIEVHPFIGCGLYGFEGPDVLRMASAAWKHHVRQCAEKGAV